jgi:hypothetical protein
MNSTQRRYGFLIMPFRDDLNWLHEEILEASLAENVDTQRADEIFTPGVILQQILDGIKRADLVFAVCTDRNPNVFFELGYAWTMHNPILIAESNDDLPFDVNAFRAIVYGGDERHAFKLRLRKTIRAAVDDKSLPIGRRLVEPPQQRQAARLTGRLMDGGRNHSFIITNTGTVDLMNVDMDVPAEARSLYVHKDDLPIEILRPGESVRLLASVTMGGGKRIFDVVLSGNTSDGNRHMFTSKISL